MTLLIIAIVFLVVLLLAIGAAISLVVGGPGGDAVELLVDGVRKLFGRERPKPHQPRSDDQPGGPRWPSRGEQALWCPTCGAPVDVRAPACPRCGRPVGS